MTAAIELSKKFKVTLITKNSLIDSSTWYAQGGIAAVIDSKDSIEEHLRDTLIAGDGLCNEVAVRQCVAEGKSAIEWLANLGTKFTQSKENKLHLTQEGGHSKRRVVHADDATGREVSSSLAQIVKGSNNIEILENHICIDLVTENNICIGAYVLDIESNKVKAINAGSTILATGGASKVYLYTSNPDGSSGDGIGLAWRAGCSVENLEFNQFHPTCLFHPEAKSFLLSEALRGEGAILKNHNDERFMEKYDSRWSLRLGI
jgi:L-aspartate oxidase